MEGFFQSVHLLIIFFIAAMMFGIVPFVAGYFVGSRVERKKSLKQTQQAGNSHHL